MLFTATRRPYLLFSLSRTIQDYIERDRIGLKPDCSIIIYSVSPSVRLGFFKGKCKRLVDQQSNLLNRNRGIEGPCGVRSNRSDVVTYRPMTVTPNGPNRLHHGKQILLLFFFSFFFLIPPQQPTQFIIPTDPSSDMNGEREREKALVAANR